jgi:L-threonylcarbamoyladenylate synthase
LAHNLFQGLLFFNNHPVDHIIGEGTDGGGIGMAIMNRLTKASGTHIINMN